MHIFTILVVKKFTYGICEKSTFQKNEKKQKKTKKNKKNFKYFLVAESLCFVGFATFEELPETKK